MDRRIDAALAIHLFGWVVENTEHGWPPSVEMAGYVFGCPPRRYSSTWDGMGLVVEAMRARGYPFQLSKGQRERWYCLFVADSQYAGVADTAFFAVALAALRALGVEVPAE